VEHPVDVGEQRGQVGGVQVGLVEGEARLRDRREVAALDRDLVVVGQDVDADDLVALAQQLAREVAAHETGHAGHECSHRGFLIFSWG
jgi:hypothetical protein